MPTIDWDKWNLGWAAGLPKNEMWSKIRNGKNDSSGEPLHRYPEREDKSSADPKIADVIAEHRFTNPALSSGIVHSCFCGWSGNDHAEHLLEKVSELSDQQPDVIQKKKADKGSSGDE